MTESAFWDKLYSTNPYSREPVPAVLNAALEHFGDVQGKTILEVGCGPGASALYLASLGADVIAVDTSSKAVADLMEFCTSHGVANIRPIRLNALDLDPADLGQVDFVFGSMILHHLEPFGQFVDRLRHILKPGGKAFFYENNAASRLLVWFRQHVVGKFWVPKYGDDDEFPLTPQEIDQLRGHFDVRIVHPEMAFFGLIAAYLLRNRLHGPLQALDRFFYRRRWLLRYSYVQYVLISG